MMINSAIIILLALLGMFVLTAGFALLMKIWSVNPEELAEVKRIQGGLSNVINGTLNNPPNEFGDYRVVRGLKWDKKSKKYLSQSALSSEGLRSAFPK